MLCFDSAILSNNTLIAVFATLAVRFVGFVAACLDGYDDERFVRSFAAAALVNVDLFIRVLRISSPAFVLRLSFPFSVSCFGDAV